MTNKIYLFDHITMSFEYRDVFDETEDAWLVTNYRKKPPKILKNVTYWADNKIEALKLAILGEIELQRAFSSDYVVVMSSLKREEKMRQLLKLEIENEKSQTNDRRVIS